MGEKTCPQCNGSGRNNDSYLQSITNTCRECGGTGKVFTTGAGDGTCFPGDARVSTPTGWRLMADLRIGDYVKSVNGNGHVTSQRISRVIQHGEAPVLTVHTDGGQFDVTASHAMKTQRGWVRVGQLKQGDTLHHIGETGEVTHQVFEKTVDNKRSVPVFNLIVEGDYTFIVEGHIAHSFAYFIAPRVMFHKVASWLSRKRHVLRAQTSA